MSRAELIEVPVRTPAGEYPVLIGEGLLGRVAELVAKHAAAHRYAVIADDRVAALYGAAVRDALAGARPGVELLSFPAGESNKTRERWAELSDQMLAAGFGRDSGVVALGGGVTGDLAGFVAATYMRGLPVVQVPTSLLAMIDSSVGGKTGVDTPGGKNLIGAFLQPQVVIADPATLATLPPEELRSGLAEALKHGAIADAAYFAEIADGAATLLAGDGGALTRLVARSVEIKAEVVGRDEKESGPRRILNFGHTLGHAVEAVSGYTLLHGEAISIGMVLEARLGERLGVTEPGTAEALIAALECLELPTRVPDGMDAGAVLHATRSDKKARQGRVEYSLIERIGRASAGPDGRWGWPVEDDAVRETLEQGR